MTRTREKQEEDAKKSMTTMGKKYRAETTSVEDEDRLALSSS